MPCFYDTRPKYIDSHRCAHFSLACTAYCNDPLLLWLKKGMPCYQTARTEGNIVLFVHCFCSIWHSHLIDLYLPRQLNILIPDNQIHYSTLSTPDLDSEMMNCKMALRCHIKRLEMREKSLIKEFKPLLSSTWQQRKAVLVINFPFWSWGGLFVTMHQLGPERFFIGMEMAYCLWKHTKWAFLNLFCPHLEAMLSLWDDS